MFVDENKDLTDDCKGMQDCENCEIVSCKPQTFEGQDQIGRPYSIIQYVYSSKHIKRQYINGLTKAIAEASVKGEYVDPLRNIYRAAKQKEFHSSTKSQNNRQKLTESKQYNTNMNKNKIRLTESQLHRIIKESVRNVLNEARNQFYRCEGHNSKNRKKAMEELSWASKIVPVVGGYIGFETWDDYYIWKNQK